MTVRDQGEYTVVVSPEPAPIVNADSECRPTEWKCTVLHNDNVLGGFVGRYGKAFEWANQTIRSHMLFERIFEGGE